MVDFSMTLGLELGLTEKRKEDEFKSMEITTRAGRHCSKTRKSETKSRDHGNPTWAAVIIKEGSRNATARESAAKAPPSPSLI